MGAGDFPSWSHFLDGVGLLMYQMLDNIDGRQARRTGTASPLGLFFDHGCDALVAGFVAIGGANTLALGPTWKAFSISSLVMISFFASSWEQAILGGLHPCLPLCFLSLFE